MRKFAKALVGLAAAVAVVLLGACSSVEELEGADALTVRLSGGSGGSLGGVTVVATDLKSSIKYSAVSNSNGVAYIYDAPFGLYNIEAEDLADGVSTMFGTLFSVSFTSFGDSFGLKMNSLVSSLEKSFVLDELYFNCSSNGDWDYNYYERYFTIRNVSDRALYIDGLSFGITADHNTIDQATKMDEKMASGVLVISQMYTIPGNGTQYLLQPEESVVIAHSAIDHTFGGTKPNAVNLTGADFEIFVEHEWSMTVDNPEVPNVVVNYSAMEAFEWQYSGATPMVLFKIDGDRAAFVKNSLEEYDHPGGYMTQNYINLPIDNIVDIAATGIINSHYKRVTPMSHDKSPLLIPGTGMMGMDGFQQYFVRRKRVAGSNGETAKDTNDSSSDLEMIVGGQQSYPTK